MLPDGPLSLLKKHPLLGNQYLASIGWKELGSPKGNSEKESIHAFFARRTTKEVIILSSSLRSSVLLGLGPLCLSERPNPNRELATYAGYLLRSSELIYANIIFSF